MGVVDVALVILHFKPCIYIFGWPQWYGTQSQAQVQPASGQADMAAGTEYVARRFHGVLYLYQQRLPPL